MKSIIAVALLTFSFAALAEKPYGMAGCGWGSQLMGKDGNQVIAVTTNETGSQTFGISSGTSNCVTATEQTARIKNFIEANYESLITDMAKGRGDSVDTLASMYGCDTSTFATELQSNYEVVAPSHIDATKMMVGIHNIIEDSSSLRTNCKHAI